MTDEQAEQLQLDLKELLDSLKEESDDGKIVFRYGNKAHLAVYRLLQAYGIVP